MKNLSEKQKAEAELAKRELARRHLKDFVLYNFKDFKLNWHHEIIFEKLEQVERGEIKRIMFFLPPRHGKSEIGSVQFPVWAIGKNKNRHIIEASYSADLATDFGRQARNLIKTREYQNVFRGVDLAEDSEAKGKWNTNGRGAYNAVGVGGATTGKGADFLIIDDPVKNRQDAESEVIRNNIWNWYRSTARTRLSPTGSIILIMCMTGDTKVLMADKSEKELRDINVEDKISTYKNGKLSISKVKNWKNCGKDKVFKIKTYNGKMVRANERHPFLIYKDKKLQWIRVKNLNIHQKIVILKGNGVNGKKKNVYGKDAKNQQNAGGIACHTIIKKSGQMAQELLQIIKKIVERYALKEIIILQLKNIGSFLKNKMVNVLYVVSHRKIMCGLIGGGSCALTIATKQERLGDYYATTATSQSDIQKQKKQPLRLPNTSDFILDEILSIEEDGTEEVFDIEVEKTANFIANGVVSHNTRWHDDDLAGRILQKSTEWEIVKFPAIAERDEQYRKKGEALWADFFNKDILEKTKEDIGNYEWAALYNQEPISSEFQEFYKYYFKARDEDEVDKIKTRNFLTIDTAISEKAQSDYTGFCDNSVDSENNWNLSAWRQRLSPKDLIDILFILHGKRSYEKIGIEKTIYLQTLKPFLNDEQRKRNKFLPIVELEHKQVNKELRIRGLLPRYQAGAIYHIKGKCKDLEEEALRFPKGVHDDVLDATAYQLQISEAPTAIHKKTYWESVYDGEFSKQYEDNKLTNPAR